MKKHNQSIFDSLFKSIPLLKDKNYVPSNIADSLFSLWKSGKSKKDNKSYKRPNSLSYHEVQSMQKEGLIRTIGDNIEITSKGKEAIKVMILGDDRSIFEDDGLVIDYNTALENTKNVKIAKKNKVANSWWDRF